MSKRVAIAYVFTSSSTPDKFYQTLQYDDGSTSCDCPGWTRRVQSDGSRTCKHVRSVDAGMARHECTRIIDYNDSSRTQPIPTPVTTPKRRKKEKLNLERVSRRFDFSMA